MQSIRETSIDDPNRLASSTRTGDALALSTCRKLTKCYSRGPVFGMRNRLALSYFGGLAGFCLKSKQSDMSSDCLTRLFGVARLKMVSQNLIRLTVGGK
jgi:hypothetical protein